VNQEAARQLKIALPRFSHKDGAMWRLKTGVTENRGIREEIGGDGWKGCAADPG
jgi:hypothetical protein